MSPALTVANSTWECVDGRVWGGSAIAMCVSAGSRMFWSVLINNSLGRLEAGAGTEAKPWGLGDRQEGGACPGWMVAPVCSSHNEGQQGGSCCFLS